MKKYIFTLLLLSACHLIYGQNIDKLFDEFGKEPNAECVHISPFMMSIGRLFASNGEEGKIMGKINSMRVLDLEECPAEVKERFDKQAGKAATGEYEELMRVNDQGEKVRIWMKMQKEVIRELLFVCTGNGDCTLVQIKGKFSKDDIDILVNEETGKKHGSR